MAWVSFEHRFVFIAAPGTASTAIIAAFKENGIGQEWPETEIVKDGRRITPQKHASIEELKRGGVFDPLSGFTVLTGVRNMYAWRVAVYLRNRTKRMEEIADPSSWISKLPKFDKQKAIANIRRDAGMSFGQSVREYFDRHVDGVNVHQKFHNEADIFLHQETLDTDFDLIRDKFGLPKTLKVQRVGVTNALKDGKTYKDFYDGPLREYFYQKNKPFFDLFPEYTFEGIDEELATQRTRHAIELL